jgi:hypothetical protein
MYGRSNIEPPAGRFANEGVADFFYTYANKAIYKGVEGRVRTDDSYCRRPDLLVKRVMDMGELPDHCEVALCEFPGSTFTRCALFGIDVLDLHKRSAGLWATLGKIAEGGDHAFGLNIFQLRNLLREMTIHAGVVQPSIYRDHFVMEKMFTGIGQPEFFRYMQSGDLRALPYLVSAVRGQ